MYIYRLNMQQRKPISVLLPVLFFILASVSCSKKLVPEKPVLNRYRKPAGFPPLSDIDIPISIAPKACI